MDVGLGAGLADAYIKKTENNGCERKRRVESSKHGGRYNALLYDAPTSGATRISRMTRMTTTLTSLGQTIQRWLSSDALNG